MRIGGLSRAASAPPAPEEQKFLRRFFSKSGHFLPSAGLVTG
jgi:hypothetical protein